MRVILTGATGGFGVALVQALAKDGARLLLVGRQRSELEALQSRIGGETEICLADLRTTTAAGDIVRGNWLAPDVLINNAAIQGPIGPTWETGAAEWQECLTVNLALPIELCRAVLPGMLARGRGKIINLSGGGATGPRPGFGAYAVAKTGLVRFSENLAAELAGKGIDVNCVAPGAMPTKMLAAVAQAGAERAGAKEMEAVAKAAAAGEETMRKAVALCLYLASAQSDGITGKLISALWDPWATLQDRRADIDNSDIYTLRRIVPADRGKDWGG
jgi:3-oxoacyl-[acyl-carrier protein] reductase